MVHLDTSLAARPIKCVFIIGFACWLFLATSLAVWIIKQLSCQKIFQKYQDPWDLESIPGPWKVLFIVFTVFRAGFATCTWTLDSTLFIRKAIPVLGLKKTASIYTSQERIDQWQSSRSPRFGSEGRSDQGPGVLNDIRSGWILKSKCYLFSTSVSVWHLFMRQDQIKHGQDYLLHRKK